MVAMPSDRDDVLDAVSNWFDHGVSLPVELGKEMDTLRQFSYMDMRGNPGLREHVRLIIRRLERLSSNLAGLASAVTEQIDAFGIVSRNCGIALLPNEVLAKILDLVVNTAEKKRQTTVELSHVARQFRSMMLEWPKFWTNMYSWSHPEMIKLLSSRARGLPLTVDLNVYCFSSPDECRLDPAFTDLVSLAEHWRTLHVIHAWTFYDREKRNRLQTAESWHHVSIHGPLLEVLAIIALEFHAAPLHAFDWSRWTFPRLREAIFDNYFPFLLPGLSQVSVLSLTLRVTDGKMGEILAEVVKMKNVQDLTLELSNTLQDHDITAFGRFEIRQVKRLRIITTLHYKEDDLSPALKRSIFSSLFFPGVDDLILQLKGSEFSVPENHWRDTYIRHFYFNKEINRIFRNIDQFPIASYFYLHISSPFGDREDSEGRSEIYVPLNMLPSLKRFAFSSDTRFHIVEPEDPDETYYEDEDVVAPRVIGDAFPLLESMTLDMEDFMDSATAHWVQEYLHKMMDRGGWDASFKLLVGEYHSSGHRWTNYVGDKALEWCSNMLINKDQGDGGDKEKGEDSEECAPSVEHFVMEPFERLFFV
ncbi:hypothetical protein SCHPADRAFT_1001181 [Schizopora paradoxa]|uniref:F-box domain-containing protein n=1 Tax=Schizopora paradoxa TaxID=27342 RepID=A0A0H2R9P2_9AGAM|nr:hypothetical protein SCHPADRAFT_1001181 [Schizopora paradoxa]